MIMSLSSMCASDGRIPLFDLSLHDSDYRIYNEHERNTIRSRETEAFGV
jgi:hypothetical protein